MREAGRQRCIRKAGRRRQVLEIREYFRRGCVRSLDDVPVSSAVKKKKDVKSN